MNNRWLPTEPRPGQTTTEIRRLLTDTDSRRSELSIVLRNQKVSRVRPDGRSKNINRTIHFIYFKPETKAARSNSEVDRSNPQGHERMADCLLGPYATKRPGQTAVV